MKYEGRRVSKKDKYDYRKIVNINCVNVGANGSRLSTFKLCFESQLRSSNRRDIRIQRRYSCYQIISIEIK